MKRMLALCVTLVFVIIGCGEKEQQAPAVGNGADPVKRVSAVSAEQPSAGSSLKTASQGGVQVVIKPPNPSAGDCLEAIVKGLPDATFVWELNGGNVQEDKNNRYCPEDASRDDVVTVSVGSAAKGGSASVTFGNALPRILDTSFAFVPEDGAYVIEVTPQTEDADADYVTLSYQWLINGQVNEEFTENRLPANAYQTGDKIQVKITPEDGYGTGRTYTSRNLEMLSAAPVITSQPPKSFEAMEYTYQVEATDVDSSELTFSLEDAPDGMTIDASTPV